MLEVRNLHARIGNTLGCAHRQWLCEEGVAETADGVCRRGSETALRLA